jgi:hypothetical protein
MLIAGWGGRLKESRLTDKEPVFGEYIPDQQGCYERSSREGGTLACGPESYSGQRNTVVLGVAKTKGKCRVVTMQSAEVKRKLTPIHNALYDHISSFGWCVRGDVQKQDFEAVIKDKRDGEKYISGDYKAATDNIYLPAVFAIIDEVSKEKELTEDERNVLLESFSDLRYKLSRCQPGRGNSIKRGSMMGNLVSFPLLCLLNKACFDIACDIRCNEENGRVGRFNGDDCLFCGDEEFLGTWTRVTERFGFVVNKEKTGMSRRWLELNSSVFDRRKSKFVGKPVLSFLLPDRRAPGSILKSIVDGIRTFRFSVQLKIVNVMLRHEISLRGPLEEFACLGRRWREELVRRSWFRKACLVGQAPVLETGVRRHVETAVGPLPHPRIYKFILEKSAVLQRESVDLWLGKRVKPLRQRIDRSHYKLQMRGTFPALRNIYKYVGQRWAFVWPKELLVFMQDRFPQYLRSWHFAKWVDDSPLLTTRPHFEVLKRCSTIKNPLFAPPSKPKILLPTRGDF